MKFLVLNRGRSVQDRSTTTPARPQQFLRRALESVCSTYHLDSHPYFLICLISIAERTHSRCLLAPFISPSTFLLRRDSFLPGFVSPSSRPRSPHYRLSISHGCNAPALLWRPIVRQPSVNTEPFSLFENLASSPEIPPRSY